MACLGMVAPNTSFSVVLPYEISLRCCDIKHLACLQNFSVVLPHQRHGLSSNGRSQHKISLWCCHIKHMACIRTVGPNKNFCVSLIYATARVGLYKFAGVVCSRGATLLSKWPRNHNSGLVRLCWGRLLERCKQLGGLPVQIRCSGVFP